MTLDDTLAAIDAVIEACAQCNRPRGDSPSDDFCSEACQRRWAMSRTVDPEKVLGFDREREIETFRVMRAQLDRDMQAYARHVREVAVPAWAESMRRVGAAFQGIPAPRFVLDEVRGHACDEEPGETPQQRALRLRRERNTGPRRERYAKRGRG